MTIPPSASTARAPKPEDRPYDVVVWGATGFTGRLIAEYLARLSGNPEPLRWAIAGRRREALEALRRQLAELAPSVSELPILTGDSHDPDSLDALARQTRAVCAAAGPFALHGAELVAACVRNGTHYCDITGEPAWIRQMIDAHHEQAQQNRVRVVHCCGVDSVPSDLGCFMVHEHLQRHHSLRPSRVKCLVTLWPRGYSGGTYASMFHFWQQAGRDKALRKSMLHPYALNSADHRSGPDQPERPGSRKDPDTGHHTGMFLMGPVNSRIVRRSNELLDYAYGEQFQYSEERGFGPGAGGWWRAKQANTRLMSFFLGGMIPPTRWLLRRVLPAQGAGPSQSQRKRGAIRFEHHAFTEPDAAGNVKHIVGLVHGPLDTYDVTAITAAESALCLARDTDRLPDRYGVLTPAAAMGAALLERLRRTDLAFEIEER
ncbi:MAG: saccharopine dehydrogenase NADP-binding domain-containing protein [bacterium]